jgi:hypothetical protein
MVAGAKENVRKKKGCNFIFSEKRTLRYGEKIQEILS